MRRYALCAGCVRGGAFLTAPSGSCARKKGLDHYCFCGELEGCGNFGWLGDRGEEMKDALKRARGISKEDCAKAFRG